MALRGLIAVQLAALVALAGVTVWRFPVWALVDERAHYDYVQTVAEEGRLPDLRDELISPEAEAIDEGVFPGPPRTDPATRGLAGRSYEAFQPPLYYLVAAGPFAAGGDHLAKVRVLRLLGVGCLLLAAFLLWRLARGSPAVFAVALCFLLWPGVVVRTVTASNAALELPLALGALLAARAAHERRDGRLLVLAGALAGLGLLTRLSLVVLLPVLAVVALLHVRAGGRRGTAALALVLPALLLAPWIASNVERYGAPTASALVREMQDPVLNPSGRDLGDRRPAGPARAAARGRDRRGMVVGAALARQAAAARRVPAARARRPARARARAPPAGMGAAVRAARARDRADERRAAAGELGLLLSALPLRRAARRRRRDRRGARPRRAALRGDRHLARCWRSGRTSARSRRSRPDRRQPASRASRSAQVSRRTTTRAAPPAAKTTGILRLPL